MSPPSPVLPTAVIQHNTNPRVHRQQNPMAEAEMSTQTPTPTSPQAQTDHRLSRLRTKPLTPKQERRLVAYLDDQFLQLTRGYKKRTTPSTTVPTLHKYISFARRLLGFILQIPPVDPSTSLRTQYMLRLTGDVLSAIVGYGLPSRSGGQSRPQMNDKQDESEKTEGRVELSGDEDEPRDYASALRELLDWLDDLDQAWLAVLQSQVWDPEVGEGMDLILDVGSDRNSSASEATENDDPGQQTNGMRNHTLAGARAPKSTPMSQTDVTRLRSLLVTSIANLEEWLSRGARPPELSSAGGDEDIGGMLERLGLLDEFDELFRRTMDFLGGFGGFVIEPDTIVEDDDDEDMSDMVEITMSGCS